MKYSSESPTRTGVTLPPSPEVRLIPRSRRATSREWDVPLPQQGTWRVLGAAGSGVSSLLIDVVLAQLNAGADASGILVVAPSKESGSLLRRELAENLDDYAAQTSMVRSVHSLAFALLRHSSEEELRLITGAEQDAVIRELLQGHAADRRGAWPEEMRPALEYVGFARQLRDLLLRAIERGLGPTDLEELGQRYGRPMWVAAGDFLREYERTQALAGSHSYSAAELVSQVLLRPELLREHPWHTIVVDDAQLLDPTSGQLIAELAKTARLTVIGGDPDQAVFAFRGANSEFLTTWKAENELRLSSTYLGTTVFSGANPPALTDIVPSAAPRPVGWSAALVIVDGLIAGAVDDDISARFASVPGIQQLLLRAVAYRRYVNSLHPRSKATVRSNIERVEEALVSAASDTL